MNSTRYAGEVVAAAFTLLLVFTTDRAFAVENPNGSIKGTVTNAVTGERLRKSYVRLAPASERNKVRPAVTDEEGRFTFEDVAPDNYSLEAEHSGFIDGRYGDELRLAPGQDLSDLNIKLMPPATISGSVKDEDGDPWTHAGVSVFSVVWERGKRQLAGLDSAEVDDRGEFRIRHLPPGRYYLCAEPAAEWERNNRRESAPRLQPTWYPSALDSSGATAVVLTPGQELTGVEIRLRRSSVYRIRGKISGLQAIPPLPGPSPWMKPRLTASPVSGSNGNSNWTSMQPDGSFEVEGVAPGTYELTVSQGALPRFELGSATVAIADHDIEDVSINIVAPHPLKGSIRIDGEPSALPGRLLLWLDSSAMPGPEPTATPRADGSFEFPYVTSGRASVHVGGAYSISYFVKSVRYAGVESTGPAFSISSGEASLDVILSARGGQVNGTVRRSSGGEARSPQVLLLPETSDPELRTYDTQVGVLDQTQAFTIKDAVRPGDYTLYAFEEVPQGAWTDAEFLKEMDGKGVRIKIAEGEAKTVEVVLIRRSDIATVLTKLGMN